MKEDHGQCKSILHIKLIHEIEFDLSVVDIKTRLSISSVCRGSVGLPFTKNMYKSIFNVIIIIIIIMRLPRLVANRIRMGKRNSCPDHVQMHAV